MNNYSNKSSETMPQNLSLNTGNLVILFLAFIWALAGALAIGVS